MDDIFRQAQLQRIVSAIIESVTAAVTVTDERGVIMFANTAAEKLFALPLNEIIGRAYADVVFNITALDGKPMPQEEYPFNQVLQKKEPVYGVEYAAKRPDGTRIVVSVNAAALAENHDSVLGVVETLTDITGQKRLAQQIEPDLLQRIINSVPEPVSYLDKDLVYRVINTNAAQVLGYSPDEVIGHPLVEVVKENPHIYELVKKARDTGESYSDIIAFIPPGSKATRHFFAYYIPDKDPAGKVLGVFGVGIDVT